MLYSYGSFLSKITLSLLCIVAPVPYVSINPSKKREVQAVLVYTLIMKKTKEQLIQDLQSKIKGLKILISTITNLEFESEERIEISRAIATNLRAVLSAGDDGKNLVEKCGLGAKLLFPLYGYYSLNLVPTYQLLMCTISNNNIFVSTSDDIGKENVVWKTYLTFSSWLNEVVIDTKLPNVEPISRFLAIKIISDKEGAHVDDKVEQHLFEMCQSSVLPVRVDGFLENKEIKAKSIFCETIVSIAKEFVFSYENYQNNRIELIGPSKFNGVIQVYTANNTKFNLYKFGTTSKEYEEHSYNSNSYYECKIYQKTANVYQIKQGTMKYSSIILNENDLIAGDFLGTFLYGK